MQQRLMTVSTVSKDNGLGVHFDFDKGKGRTEENRNESAKIRRGNGYTYSEGFKRNIVMQFYSRPDGMLIKDFAKSVGVNRDSLLAWRGKYKPEDPLGFRAKQTAMQTSIASDKSNAKELVEKPVEKAKAKGVKDIVDCRPFHCGVCRIPAKGLSDQGGIDTCQRR